MPNGRHRHRQLNVRVSDKTHAILHSLADDLGVSQATVITTLVRKAFKGDSKQLAQVMARWTRAQIIRRAERAIDEELNG